MVKKYVKEPFPALSHLVGAGLSVVALFFLLRASGDRPTALVVSIVYGLSLVTLYMASALMHGIHCSPETCKRLEQYDHAAIFILIAGTYTPVCLLVVKGFLGWGMLAAEWIFAFIGIKSVFNGDTKGRNQQVLTYLAMGWLCLIALKPIAENMSISLLSWLFCGGFFYSIGSIIFLKNRPNLWDQKFTAHDLWHVMVMAGSASHFVVIYELVATL